MELENRRVEQRFESLPGHVRERHGLEEHLGLIDRLPHTLHLLFGARNVGATWVRILTDETCQQRLVLFQLRLELLVLSATRKCVKDAEAQQQHGDEAADRKEKISF